MEGFRVYLFLLLGFTFFCFFPCAFHCSAGLYQGLRVYLFFAFRVCFCLVLGFAFFCFLPLWFFPLCKGFFV